MTDRRDRSTASQAQVRLLGTGPRRWRGLGFGAALMAVGGLIAATAVGRLDDRQGVLVATGDLPAGHVVAAEDLKVADIGGADGLSVIPDDRLEETVGQILNVPVSEGSVLPNTALGPKAAYPGAGEAVVGAALAPGRFPASVRPGAQVSVVISSDSGTDTGGAQDGSGGQAFGARLQSFEEAEDGGVALVELVVDAGDAAQVASAAAAERISVVQVRARGGD